MGLKGEESTSGWSARLMRDSLAIAGCAFRRSLRGASGGAAAALLSARQCDHDVLACPGEQQTAAIELCQTQLQQAHRATPWHALLWRIMGKLRQRRPFLFGQLPEKSLIPVSAWHMPPRRFMAIPVLLRPLGLGARFRPRRCRFACHSEAFRG